MRRRDRRPAKRPPLQPSVRLATGTSDYGRELASALAAAFSPACAWEWACTISVTMAGSPLVVLRFERHEPSGRPEILDSYEYSWREQPDAPVADVQRYARSVMQAVSEVRRDAVLDHCNAWGLEH